MDMALPDRYNTQSVQLWIMVLRQQLTHDIGISIMTLLVTLTCLTHRSLPNNVKLPSQHWLTAPSH